MNGAARSIRPMSGHGWRHRALLFLKDFFLWPAWNVKRVKKKNGMRLVRYKKLKSTWPTQQSGAGGCQNICGAVCGVGAAQQPAARRHEYILSARK